MLDSSMLSSIGVLSLLFIILVFPVSTAQGTNTTTASEPFWTKGAPMPTPRSEVAIAISADNIYVIGGFDESDQVSDIVEVYNTNNNSWTKAVPLPQSLHHTAAASFDGKIYVIGGYTSAVTEQPWSAINKLFIYDPLENKWQEGKPMPTARGALNAAFINGILYAVGGVSSNIPVNTNEAYSPTDNSWTTRKPMPTARHHAASAVADEKLYVIGGRSGLGGGSVNANEMYDPGQNKWMIYEPMPSKRGGIAAASLVNGSNIFVFGGEERSGTFNNNERYNVKDMKWIFEPPMSTARHGLGAISHEDKIYVIGGGPQPGLSVSNVNEIFHTR
jgi:N-acetylneuraminic acid mutarotase